jgi:MFS family permease
MTGGADTPDAIAGAVGATGTARTAVAASARGTDTPRAGTAGASSGAARAAPAGSDGLWSPAYRSLTSGLVLTVTLVAFEALAVVTILPIVVGDLGDLPLYGWVTSAFFLGTVIGIVVAGSATDRGGPVRPFVLGLGLFAVGLVVSGLAPTMHVLVLGRLIQGLGAGATPAVAYASIGRTMPESLRPRMFATLSTAWVVPGLGGPALSALVADRIGWRVVFLGLLPLVGVAGFVAVRALSRLDPPDGADAAPTHLHTPLLTAVRISAGAGLLLLGLTTRSAFGLIPVAAGLALGLRPLIRLLPSGTFRARAGVPAAVLARGLLTFAFFGADSFVPLAFTSVRHTSTAVAGIAVTSATVAWTSGSWAQARSATRVTCRRLVTCGLALVTLGVALVAAALNGAVPVPAAIAAWGLAGFGIGLAYGPLSLVVLADASPSRQGAASTSLQLSDNLGTAFGAGVSGVAVAAGHAAGAGPAVGIVVAFGIAASVGLGGVLVATRIPATTVPRA